MGGNLHLILSGTDLNDPGGQLIDLRLNCGPGWETTDGGTAVHTRFHSFVNTTKVGKFIARMIDILGMPQVESLGEATNAKTYANLVFHIVVEEREYPGFMRDGIQVAAGTTRDQLPTEIWLDEAAYLASIGSPGKVATGSRKADEVRRRIASKGNHPASTPVMARLDSFAKTSDSFEAFVEKALELDEVANDDDLVEMVSNEAESGFYATHK
jgi:hypothetical protein